MEQSEKSQESLGKGWYQSKALLSVSPGEITQRYVVEKFVKFEVRCGVSNLGRS